MFIKSLGSIFSHNLLTYSLKALLQFGWEILYFPVWWYSVGFGRTALSLWQIFKAQEKNIGFSVWLKNIFVPMYGQSDIAGRLISLAMRLVQIIFRGVLLMVWFLILASLLIIWLLAPIWLFLAISWQLQALV